MISWEHCVAQARVHEHKSVEGKISCSSLPMRAKCAAFQNDGIAGEAAFTGTCIHNFMEANLVEMLDKLDGPYGLELDVPLEEKTIILCFVDSISKLVKQGWHIVEMEQFADNNLICGSADLILGNESRRMVVDYKTGFNQVEASSPQMDGYRWLFNCDTACVLQGNIARINEHGDPKESVMKIITSDTVNPGGHCAHCIHAGDCEVLKGAAIAMPDVSDPTAVPYWLEMKAAFKSAGEKASKMALQNIDKYPGFKVQRKKNKKLKSMQDLLSKEEIPPHCLTLSQKELKNAGIEIDDEYYDITYTEYVTRDRGKK